MLATGVTVAAGMLSPVLTSPAGAVPGSPGVTSPGVTIYSEDFSNMPAAGAPIQIGDYVGGPAADGETYFADAAWSPGYAACNGWVMQQGTPLPSGSGGAVGDDECARNEGFTILGRMAVAMGQFQGMDAATAADNQILTQYSNSVNGAQAAGVQLRTTNNSIPTVAGHYYAVSGVFAQTNCFSNHAKQEFSILVNGVPTVVGSNLDPCTDPLAEVIFVENTRFSVAKLQSNAIQIPTTGVTPMLGIQVRNLQATGTGNDAGFDLPQLVDVTPQLDKEFTPASMSQGETTTLTYTVTNTNDLMAKDGWHFVDDLPAGLTASDPVGGTCELTSSSAAGSAIDITGNLALGAPSCTITVQVTSDIPGAYNNSGCVDNLGAVIPDCTNNITTITGLNPPGTTPLTVLPVIDVSIAKTVDVASYSPSEPITYTVVVNNAGPSDAINATFSDPLPEAVTGASWTCEVTELGAPTLPPFEPTSCTANGTGNVSDTVRINAGGSLTYTITGTVADGTSGELVNTATIVPAETTDVPNMPGGGPNPEPDSTTPVTTVDTNCPPSPGPGCSSTIATPGSAIDLEKSIDSVTDTNGNGITDEGDVIHYSILTTNAGDARLSDVTVSDQLAAPAGPALSLSCTPTIPATLAPGDTINCVADYMVTRDDTLHGTIENTATTTGTPPDGPNVTDSDTVIEPTSGTGAIILEKSSTTTSVVQVGQRVTYEFLVKNVGTALLNNVTVTDVVQEPSLQGDLGPITCGPENATNGTLTLAPDEKVVCRAEYTVTSADLGALAVRDIAVATGTPPTGDPVTSPEDSLSIPVRSTVAPTGPTQLVTTGMNTPSGPWILASIAAVGAGIMVIRRGRLTLRKR
ncbi:hypothetical protein ACFWHR_12300 [Leucobacter sp. NPDC058333]|uniref:DUF7507 domain-containing protein n=1 Tax=Leucobacter sp. NPDC058333 TaxID=3346450 RepID=UPI003667C978